jgi:hypothetical protein
MATFSLRENIIYSYRTYFRLVKKTFFAGRNGAAPLTARRLVRTLCFSLLLLVVQTVHWLAFALDEVLYRDYRSVDVRHPLFIVGMPRSGTTFLHRLLSQDTDRFTTFTLWELLMAPSITERKIVFGLAALDRTLGAPFKALLKLMEKRTFHAMSDIHAISLSDPEEDYLTLIPIYACFLMILPFPFREELGHLAFFDDETPPGDKKRIMGFYNACLQRHLYIHGTGKTLLSKNVSFAPMIATLAQTFPDARFIGSVRNPLSAVPSHISSMMEGAALFDHPVRGEAFRDQMIAIQRYACSRLTMVLPRLPEERQITVRMEDLQTNLYRVIRGIYRRFGFDVSPAFDAYLSTQDRRQKSFKSCHRYDLATYELSSEAIFRRFVDLCDRFDYSPPPVCG